MKELIFLSLFVILSTMFALAALIASYICSPKAESDEKSLTYECGMKLFSDSRVQFDIKFFNFAVMFLVFDVETIFLFPFAINFMQMKLFAFVEIIIFLLLLLFALLYAIKSNLLRWQ